MKRLMQYYLKKRLHSIIIVCAILLVIIFITQINANYIGGIYPVVPETEMNYFAKNFPGGLIITIGIILSVIFTVVEFSFKMRKVSIDQLYSLPIKKNKLYLTKYLLGLIEILVPLTLSYILMIIMIITKNHVFNLGYLFPYYIGVVILTIVLYTSLVFAFTRCNTTLDGIINMVLYSFVVSVVLYSLGFNYYGNQNNAFNFTLMSPLIYLNTIFEKCFSNNVDKITEVDLKAFIATIIESVIFAIGCAVSFFLLLNKQKSEDVEQKSNSIFAYKAMIPIYTFSLLLLYAKNGSVGMVFILIICYIGYVIKNRSFKMPKNDLIVFLIMIAFAILMLV